MKALIGKWIAFVALMTVALLSASQWQQADHWLFATLFVPAQAQPDPSVVLVELPDVGPDDPSSREFRELLGHTLEALARRGPKQVAVDVAVMNGGAALPAVVQGVTALRRANVPVYFGIHPRFDAKELAAEIYQESGLTGVGHTQLHVGRGLVFFRSVVTQPGTGTEFAFLPTLLVDRVDAWKLPEYQVFSVPKDSSRPLAHTLDPAMENLPARLTGQTVIIGSTQRECRQLSDKSRTRAAHDIVCGRPSSARVWSGPELLVWSLSHLLQGTASSMRRPVNDPVWILVAALCTAALGLLMHLLGLRLAGRVWSPTLLSRRIWVVDLAALFVVLLLLVLGEWLLVQLGWILPPAFSVVALLVSIGLCYQHSRGHLAELLTAMTRRASDDALKAEVDVFLSYSHAPDNAAWVEREIVAPLRAMTLPNGRTLRLFFDKSSITVGQDWFRRINLSILGSRCFLCVWSDDYLERDYCRWELDYAFPRAARRDFLFLPVARLSNGAQPGSAYAQYLQARQYVDASSRAGFVDELKAALQQHLGGGSR